MSLPSLTILWLGLPLMWLWTVLERLSGFPGVPETVILPSKAYTTSIFLQRRIIKTPNNTCQRQSGFEREAQETYCFTGKAPAQEPLFSVWYS